MISRWINAGSRNIGHRQIQTAMPANKSFQERRASRSLLSAILVGSVVVAGSGRLLAQDVPPPPPDQQYNQQDQQQTQQVPQYGPQDQQMQQPDGQAQYGGNPPQQAPQQNPGPQGQPLAGQQIEQLVAPIALYPDALVAQVLAAATYPTQVVEADQWRQQQGDAPPDQIAANANAQQWDPSVKALTAFPSVLSQMDRNMQWTSDLGNAYYNQPQDVMDAVQRMRQRAQAAGNLRDTQQLSINQDNGGIAIEPANPEVVYVPAYNPWVVYGPPVMAFPGYYYAPPPGVFFGVGFGFGIGFGIGIPLRPWAPWGWGWHNWGCGWHDRTIVYNRTTYITRSTTVINRGFSRPGGPPVQLAGTRGSFVNRPGYANYANRVANPRVTPGATTGARPAGQPGTNGFANRPSYNSPGSYNRPAPGNASGGYNRAPSTGYSRPAQSYAPNSGTNAYRPSAPAQNQGRPSPTYNRSMQGNSGQGNYNRPAPAPRSAPAPHAAPAPRSNGGGGGGGHHR